VSGQGNNYDLLEAVSAGPSSQPDTALMQRELGARINRAIEALTPRERIIFELKHYHGLKLRAIGTIVSASEQAVRTSFFRATRKMQGALADLR
jgi:RNA polymerase sigma-70 factor, ECF subfamily